MDGQSGVNRVCSVCIGKPLETGLDCICGGDGTEEGEIIGLRAECNRLRSQLEDDQRRVLGDFVGRMRFEAGVIRAIGLIRHSPEEAEHVLTGLIKNMEGV